MNKNRKNIIISLSALAILFVALLGISYAYYVANVTGNNEEDPSMVLKSGYLSITYTDGEEFTPIESDGTITQDKAYTKTFTVTNNGVKDGYYSVWLKDVVNPFERTQDWTYTLSIDGNEAVSSTEFPTTDKEILSSRLIGVGKSETLTLSVTYASSSEDQSADLNKTLEFSVSVVQSVSILDKASEGTLLYAINRDNTVSEPKTTPGREASASDEAVLATTEDDYGTSYYFRGNVTNNYVNFSGMCWRIVRVQGDGGIKLTLADRDGECNASTYSTSNKSSAFINNGGTYSYNSSSSSTYRSNVLFENCQIPSLLSTWAESKSLDTSKMVKTIWCNDVSSSSKSHFYGSYDRLFDITTAQPTLKCDKIKYENQIGIITIDEASFSGALTYGSGTGTFDHYLITNAETEYHTMTAYSYSTNYTTWHIYEGRPSPYNNVYDNNTANGPASIRPMVVLNKDVEITSMDQNGTQTNPYVIS